MKNLLPLAILASTSLIIISCACCANMETGTMLKDKNDTYKILHYASLAGSSHNSQPWKVEVYPNDSILIFADTSRLLDVVDPMGIELFMSIGAFLENMEIAANALGYRSEIKINEVILRLGENAKHLNLISADPEPSDAVNSESFRSRDENRTERLYKSYFHNVKSIRYNINSSLPVATVKLRKTGLNHIPADLKELELRTTLRIPFDSLNIRSIDREKLVSIAPDRIVFVTSGSPEGRFIAKKELEAYTLQAFQNEAQDELATWMRFSNKDVNSKRDGLTPAGMGINGIGGFMVRNFMKPEDSKKESFIKAGVNKTQKQVENCGGWVIISTDKDNLLEWINAGRIYERMNIQCRALNLGFHPMNQIIEVQDIAREVNTKLMHGKTIRFVARIGYVDDYPAPVSKRRAVESFTVFK